MLIVFISVFSVMIITMIIMAVGVMFGREPIKGSCGGLGAVGVERACGCVDVCQNEVATSEGTDDKQSTVAHTDSGKKSGQVNGQAGNKLGETASVEMYRP